MGIINWSQEEMFKLISLWIEDNIQDQLEGCRRNSSVFQKIAHGLCEACRLLGTLEQCRDKIKKLKKEYRKSVTKGKLQDRVDILNGNILMQ